MVRGGGSHLICVQYSEWFPKTIAIGIENCIKVDHSPRVMHKKGREKSRHSELTEKLIMQREKQLKLR